MLRILKFVLVSSILAVVLPGRAQGDEIIHLIDKTKLVAKLLHYYDGMLTIKLPNGTKMKLPGSKVHRIQFKLPKARPQYSTPKKTFELMRKAALKGDLESYVAAHSTYYQMYLNHQVMMHTPKKFTKRLKKEWGDIQLEVMGVKTKGGTAVMKVSRSKGTDSQEGELRFVKENNEWKMILPL